ncbi:MAG: TonB C-terminal domain-containing protein, partial [Verrucomicrobiota bacterium]
TDAPDNTAPPSSAPATAAATGSSPTVGPPDLGWYHQIIHDAFHKNWRQPQSLPTASNAFQTKAHISINRDGSIADARIIQASGNELMDGSVQTAIESVTRIVPLPNTIPNDTYSVVINFQLD